MRRTGVRASLYWNFIIHQIFLEFLQPLRDLRITRVSLFYRGFLFVWFWDFVGLDFLRLPRSIINQSQTQVLEKCLFQVHLPFLEPEISPTVGEEGEDEEDEEE